VKQINWYGLYGESWSDEIVPDAYSHPAKYSRGLIRQIYRHALEHGYLQAGDNVVDPFGGVALGSFDAMRYGLHWTGVELEEKFVTLGNANLDLWRGRYAPHFETWGTAQLLQGDSRQLCQVVGSAAAVVSSPPYASAMGNGGTVTDTDIEKGLLTRRENYGLTPGQLGSMREGDVQAVISSPPYADQFTQTGGGIYAKGEHSNTRAGNSMHYGNTPGNLGNMDGCISSPPFENSMNSTDEKFIVKHLEDIKRDPYSNGALSLRGTYGSDPGNIGNDTGETFWSASALIVAQVYQLLKPGGVALWVTGDFVRRRKRVMFGEQWVALCESLGFVTLEHIYAWKTEHNGTQLGMFGEDKEHRTDRVSFFRRLANEKNPDHAILNEDVWVMVKPPRQA
jgi:hypothetical protein